MTEASLKALGLLRSPDHFQWYLIPLLAFVLYVYIAEVQKKNWNIVLAGLVFFAGESCWEMINALILHLTGYSALWTTPGDTAYLVLVGLTIEIWMMFAVAGVILLKSLPEDKKARILGVPNRIFIPLAWGLFCVLVEVLLNRWGTLVWEYKWYSWPRIYSVIVVYTAPFFLITWVYDSLSLKAKKIGLLVLAAIDIAMWIVFANVLKWI